MILITTADKVGSEAARLLAHQGTPVRVLVRDPEKASSLAAAGVEVVTGDLAVPATVDAAMKDVSSVVLVSLAIPEQELNVVHSALREGAAHVVKITSDASADSPIARRRNQAEIEQGLIASGLRYTLLRNNGYMQNFLMFAPMIAATNSFSMAIGEGRVAHIDTRDVAAVAVQIASSPDAHVGKTYWPTGPEALSGSEVAHLLSDVLDRPIAFDPISFEQQRQGMINAGLPEAVADDNAKAVSLMAEGEGDYVTDDVPTILGRPARTFKEFATDYAAAFSATHPEVG